MEFSKRNILRYLSNILGWRTNRKIVVIESDDWGSTRFPDIETIDAFKKAGYNVDKCGFSRYDCLETNDDINTLVKVLQNIDGKFGKKVCITMLCNTSNPDFDKIGNSDFKEYYGKSIKTEVYSDKNRNQIIRLLQDGNEQGLFDLQYHGREHLYIQRWLRTLQNGDKETIFAFKKKVSGISPSYMHNLKKGYRSAFDLDFANDKVYQKIRLESGIDEFESIHGYKPDYFVAPNGPFTIDLEKSLAKKGVKYLGMGKIQKTPLGEGKYKTRYHWLGKKNQFQQHIITRNVIFEPMSETYGNVEKALGDIGLAFSLNKPAVISTHRANYVGGIDERNRTNGHLKLSALITGIILKWPNVLFLSSRELGDLMTKKAIK